jgi:hypothetical protein
MTFGFIVQLALFGTLALAGLVIVVGMLRAVPRPHKVKAYRYSKNGDGWLKGK